VCGGIASDINKIPQGELKKYFSSEEIAKLKRLGVFEGFYWAKVPVLPVDKDGRVELVGWGNREGVEGMPKSGWAKQESVENGKWLYLKPATVKILANRGYEKGKWFDIKSGGLKGLLVDKNNKERVYMITKPADEQYLRMTRHDRQPIEIKSRK